ncbi:MAG: TIGR04282 family arsenosugar biosynthesis glycosyltransferase [Cellvibrionaceae bacterium]
MSSLSSSCCVLQFAKLPELLKVKTRMQPVLSAEESVQLHSALTRHTYSTLATGDEWGYELWVGARGAAPDFFDLLQADSESPIRIQQGRDLGERMGHALADVLSRYQYAVIVGSDCPGLNAASISKLFEQLRQGQDGALIPATDGGYVALGLARISPFIFEGVDWGSASVLEQTLARFRTLQWNVHRAPAMSDIDRPEDLPLLSGYDWGEAWSTGGG